MQSFCSNIFALSFCISIATGCEQPSVGESLPKPKDPPRVVPAEPLVDLRKPVAVIAKEPPPPPTPTHPKKNSLGNFSMTYYWVTAESKKARGTVAIQDKHCNRIARVTKGFKRRLTLEGSGKLKDGRLVNTAGPCKCGAPCFWVPKETHKWGAGVAQRPLSPFRSIAVDPKEIRIGTSIYVAELDGLTMPGAGKEGGFVHDGCVVADDRGGGVRGKQIDFFAARRQHYMNFFKRHKLKRVTVFPGGERCKERAKAHASRVAANRGSI